MEENNEEENTEKKSKMRIGIVGIGDDGSMSVAAHMLLMSEKHKAKVLVVDSDQPATRIDYAALNKLAKNNENKFEMDFNSLGPPPQFIRPTEKISRNAQCPCGSGKKYKRCCIK